PPRFLRPPAVLAVLALGRTVHPLGRKQRLRIRLLRQLRPRVPPRAAAKIQTGAQRRPRRILVDADARPPREVHRFRRQRRLLLGEYVLLASPQRRAWPGPGVLET